jgi:pimeloyl-ACP methyl ester carboxylesterase
LGETTFMTLLAAFRQPLPRILLGLLLVALIALLSGFITQQLLTRQDRTRFPPSGQLVEAGGHRLHLLVTGREHQTPTVLLEAGASGFSAQWVWVQEGVSSFAKVVSYDRAGLGWSESSHKQPTGLEIAKQLHTALENAAIHPPYILVGHSFGGDPVRVFASEYPEEVVGVVLVDAVGPEVLDQLSPERLEQNAVELEAQIQTNPDRLKQVASIVKMVQVASLLANVGVLRLYNPFLESVKGLPEQAFARTAAFAATSQHLQASYAEFKESNLVDSLTNQQVREANGLGDKPLIVLNRTEPRDDITGAQQAGGNMQAQLSTNSQWRLVEGADHFSIIMNQTYANQVVAAIREVVEQTKH